MTDKTLTLTVTEAEGNTLISALANLPYHAVVGLINKLHAQAMPQLAAASAPSALPSLDAQPLPEPAPTAS